MKKIILTSLYALLLWFVMFSPLTKEHINFWGMMLFSTGSLTILAIFFQRNKLKRIFKFKIKHLFIGIFSAAILYLIFFVGNYIVTALFDFTKDEIANIYSTKSQASNLLIGISLLLWIGPAEEIFWRGFIQENLSKFFGDKRGFIFATLIYAGIHIVAFNFMLVIASLVCGLFWGAIYYRYRSLWPVIISHAIWDLTIFVLLPI